MAGWFGGGALVRRFAEGVLVAGVGRLRGSMLVAVDADDTSRMLGELELLRSVNGGLVGWVREAGVFSIGAVGSEGSGMSELECEDSADDATTTFDGTASRSRGSTDTRSRPLS
jgi:hypothetical protein